jgi:rhamnulokinase
MNKYYIACDFGARTCRVMMGTLEKDKLTMSEVRRFQNEPVKEKNSMHWNVPQLYQETLSALREISVYDEPVDGISCSSWPADYMLFGSDGSLLTPTYHHDDPRTEAGVKEALAKIPWETIYEETGVSKNPGNTLFQLAAERSRRLKRTNQFMPIADGFNYLLSGVPRIEMTQASATQLYSPVTRTWSDRLFKALRLPSELFPPIVPAGTKLGPVRPAIAKEAKLHDAQVVATCSHELAAALVGLPVTHGENWAFLKTGVHAAMGTTLIGPIINEATREANFTNEMGFGGSIHFYRQTVGFWILDECRRYWAEHDRDLDDDILTHLATSAPPFESLIDPTDPRFLAPGDMPLKIQAYCKDTDQPVPRKPGPILRCALESLALSYRKTLQELERHTGREFMRLYLFNGSTSNMLYHFIANALQIPVVIVPAEITSIGNAIVQAMALGHIESVDQARELARQSIKLESITPHAAAWNEAYDRLVGLVAA